MQSLLRLKKILRSSPLGAFAEQIAQSRFPGFKVRNLTPEEILQLEKNGNSCEDWTNVLVESPFDPNRIRHSIFQGSVRLPTFYGTVMTPGGVSVPTGIYRSTLYDCIIENSHIQDVSHMSGVIVSQGAILQNVGSFVASGMTSYGAGKNVAIGNEMGGRTIRIAADLTWDICESILLNRKETEALAAVEQQIDAWLLENQQKVCFVGKGAKLCNTAIARNVWIGSHARIDGAAKVRNSLLYSSLESPTEIYDGVILEGAQIQEGVRVHSFAQVRDSLLMRQCRIGREALISSSIISSCCHIEEAEVTSCFVGPLTQIHHHSLLIGTIWPDGRGNVGYGANVGSNHTGKMPDQELHVSAGVFFGLGCNIKFPTNLLESPYTLVATGVTTSPQRLKFPFSLIREPEFTPPHIGRTLNEVIPGWSFLHNAFALERGQYKFAQRSKGMGEELVLPLLNAQLARLVLDSWNRLQVNTVKDIYTSSQIDGLGSNFLREPVRQDALKSYLSYLECYAVDAALQQLESLLATAPQLENPNDVKRLFQGDLLKEIYKIIPAPDSIPSLVRRHRTLEKRWLERILNSQLRDSERGRQIFDDYDLVHPPQDDFLLWCHDRFEDARKRCNSLLKALRMAPEE